MKIDITTSKAAEIRTTAQSVENSMHEVWFALSAREAVESMGGRVRAKIDMHRLVAAQESLTELIGQIQSAAEKKSVGRNPAARQLLSKGAEGFGNPLRNAIFILEREGIKTWGSLAEKTPESLRQIGLTETSIKRLGAMLEEKGLRAKTKQVES